MWFNVGPGDRGIRLAAGLVLTWLFLAHLVVGPIGLLVALIGVTALVTGATGACPLYRMLGIDTRRPTPRHGRRLHGTAGSRSPRT